MRARSIPLRFDDEAARRWRNLIREARAQAASVALHSELPKKARTAAKTASIPGQHTRGSAGFALCRLGQTYASLSPDQRPEARAELAALADQVEAALEAATRTKTQTRRERADIDN